MTLVRSVSTTTLATAVACALAAQPVSAAPTPPSGGTEPGAKPGAVAADKPVSELLRDLGSLYKKTEAASRAYRGTAAKLKQQRSRTEQAESKLAKARSQLDDGRDEAARLARQQYRQGGAGVPPSVQLLLSKAPQHALDHGHMLERAAENQAATVQRLTQAERQRRILESKARAELAKERKLAARKKKQRDTVKDQLGKVEGMLAGLSPQELEQVGRAESGSMAGAQQQLMSAGFLGQEGRKSRPAAPSRQGERALLYALGQVGNPYDWTPAGKRTAGKRDSGKRDSGRASSGKARDEGAALAAEVWRQAGRDIPGTAGAQWRELHRVPLDRIRPGDLVRFQRDDASHVGLYAGEGKVVHAPRAGAEIQLSSVATYPLLGAVRPDPGAEPVADYRPPRLG